MDADLLIFSKDRAAQADQLLRSLAAHVRLPYAVHLLYRASDADYEQGYRLLFREHADVVAIDERKTDVDAAIRRQVQATRAQLFGLLTDDCVVIRDVGSEDEPLGRLVRDEHVACASLRLSPQKTWCQPHGVALSVPPIVGGVVDLEPQLPWPRKPPSRFVRRLRRLLGIRRPEHGCWGVPFSADGNLYRSDRFRAFLSRVPSLEHVTSVEPILTRHAGRWRGPLHCAFYAQERLVNLVMNNVDSQGERYPHPGHSLRDLNRRYLAGERLDFAPYEGGSFGACHIEVAPRYVAHPHAQQPRGAGLRYPWPPKQPAEDLR